VSSSHTNSVISLLTLSFDKCVVEKNLKIDSLLYES